MGKNELRLEELLLKQAELTAQMMETQGQIVDALKILTVAVNTIAATKSHD